MAVVRIIVLITSRRDFELRFICGSFNRRPPKNEQVSFQARPIDFAGLFAAMADLVEMRRSFQAEVADRHMPLFRQTNASIDKRARPGCEISSTIQL